MIGIAAWIAWNGPPPGGWGAAFHDPYPYVFLALVIGVWTVVLENIIQIITGATADRVAEQTAKSEAEMLSREQRDSDMLRALVGTVAAVQQDVEATTTVLAEGKMRDERIADMLRQINQTMMLVTTVAEQARVFMDRNDRAQVESVPDKGTTADDASRDAGFT